ncbi:uncharacterized protein N7482_010559 [Penicillium canariense]|uniref:Uncharacterized protein n=1 Tax=Penicillium canariense TaxID=189055 RepID=A0A9W9HKY1_9EURO|nr:uncharacterized protein N7482_010559 [Penicillium canariense]KAJ5151307.1 hypothetical protein N7482_010559 [Penicillium canariense]
MNNPGTADFLCGLEGTDVTLEPPSEPGLHLPRQPWVIEKKLSERASWMTQEEVTDGLGIPYAAAKFLCHRKENPSKKAFMRIYLQIPVIGTQYQRHHIQRKQASKPRPHTELTTLKELKKFECDVVPDLLAYQEGKQDEDSVIPGDPEDFWELDLESRQAIRDKFREAYPKLQKHGYLPCMPAMSKIIYDKVTGNMHFSGFSRADRSDTNKEWHEKYYVLFRLAKPPKTTDWVKDPKGWTW